METHWGWLGAVVVLVGVSLLIHPFWKIEGFQASSPTGSGSGSDGNGGGKGGGGGSGYVCKPEESGTGDDTIIYKYVGDGAPWSGENLREWTQLAQSISNQFQRIQKNLQDSLKTYESTEGSLEQNARKKREHWLTMTPQQRSQAKMIEDPVQEYYNTLKGASQLPLGGLPDNEGKLPFGIPQIAFPTPQESLLSPGWGASAPETRTPEQRRAEQEFYRKAPEYISTVSRPIDDLDTNIKLFSWSVRDNDKISLLPRVEMLKKQLDESKQKTRDKKGDSLKIPPKKEGFSNGDSGGNGKSSGCKTVEIVVYSWDEASKKLREYQSQLNTMESTMKTLADDVSKANAILSQIQKEADASREKARPKEKIKE
jgi:hypothetical protein